MTLMVLVHLAVFILGLYIVVTTLASAIRSFVLPRSAPDQISRAVFLTMRRIFGFRMRGKESYYERDAIMALYAPVSILSLLVFWMASVLFGFMLMFWAVGVPTWEQAFFESGSSLLTLGLAAVEGLPQQALAFVEALIGLILIALLIAYLPTMYQAFARREANVTMLEVRAGSPPSAVEALARSYRIGRLSDLSSLWVTWEVWFAELEESHTSLAPLIFFRSPRPDHHWVTAAGAILDMAAMVNAVVDVPHDPQADLCIRAGYIALRHISDFFGIPYNRNASPDDPISITREEFDEACAMLAAQGVPLKSDREQAWRDFAGWRVNYDTVLVALAGLTMAPVAPWSSDRSIIGFRPRFFVKRQEPGSTAQG
jgi:hypothetical protein